MIDGNKKDKENHKDDYEIIFRKVSSIIHFWSQKFKLILIMTMARMTTIRVTTRVTTLMTTRVTTLMSMPLSVFKLA